MIRRCIALASDDGEPLVFFGIDSGREICQGEDAGSAEHPFLRFANSRSFPDMMSALDDMLSQRPGDELYPLLYGIYDPCLEVDRKLVAELFYGGSPTRTDMRNVDSALKAWRFPEHALPKGRGEGWKLCCLPLRDVIEAREDLYNHCMLLAWSVGKASFRQAIGCGEDGGAVRFRALNETRHSTLGEYYASLSRNSGSEFSTVMLHYGPIKNIDQCRINEADPFLDLYVASAFDLLLSDTTERLDAATKRPHIKSNTVLAEAWLYLAERITKDPGVGAVAVCPYCGRLFEQRRSTKVFCGESCRKQSREKDFNPAR